MELVFPWLLCYQCCLFLGREINLLFVIDISVFSLYDQGLTPLYLALFLWKTSYVVEKFQKVKRKELHFSLCAHAYMHKDQSSQLAAKMTRVLNFRVADLGC